MNEHLLAINNFNKPKIASGADAIQNQIIKLILMEPGKLKTHPTMGVGILTRYRYCPVDMIPDLKADIMEQITKFLPMYSVVGIELGYVVNTKTLRLKIEIDKNIFYVYDANFDKSTLTLTNLMNNKKEI